MVGRPSFTRPLAALREGALTFCHNGCKCGGTPCVQEFADEYTRALDEAAAALGLEATTPPP